MATGSIPELILASGSARRRELLSMCGYRFTVIKSEAEEGGVTSDSPAGLVEKLALLKARKVLLSLPDERRKNAVVLGSDTVVVLDGNIIGKPSSREEAFTMLRSGSGRENEVFTGLATARIGRDPDSGEERVLGSAVSDRALVRFSELTDEEIDAYIATGDPMDKAGAYGIQGVFSMFIERVEGSYFTVVGLPLHLVYRELKKHGILPEMIGR